MVVGATIFTIGFVAVIASFQIPLDSDGSWGARAFPAMSASALMLLGALNMYTVFRSNTLTPDKLPARSGNFAPFQMLALVVFYWWMIGNVGYLISTGLVAPAALALFGIRNPLGLFIAALVCPVLYHLIFFEALGVFPPYGEWFDLLDVIKS